MIDAAAMPEWAAILVAALVLLGAIITLVGTIGLVRFKSFYDRIHAPTMGTSMGAIFVLLASSVYSSIGLGRPILHEVLVFIFVIVTTPVTLMLLGRAAYYRDKAEGNLGGPARDRPAQEGKQAPSP